MEKVKTGSAKKKGSLKDKGTNLSLKILALIIAVISWFVLSITQYPTVTRTITNVHVDFNMEGTKAQEKGLEALNYKELTVDVEISGMNYEIGSYSNNDLTATVDLDEVTKAGTYTLDIDVKSTHSTDRCTVLSVSPETITVSFDKITTKVIDVTTEAPEVTAADGYTLKESKISPEQVTIEGPEKVIEKIDRAAARITQSQQLSQDTVINTSDVVFYDSSDNIADTSTFSIKGEKSFDVDFVIYKKKTLEINVDISRTPIGFDKSSVPMILSDDSVYVITPDYDDEEVEQVTLGNIPLNQIDLNKTFDFKVETDEKEVNVNSIETVTVSFDSEGYTSRSFTIDADRIKLLSAPSDLDTKLETQKLTNVTLYGPEDVINALTDEDVYAQVNLGGVTKTGSYTREVTVYLPDHDNVWCYGTNEVQIVVSEIKEEETDDSSESE